MSGTIAFFCLLTIGFVLSRREHGYGYDHHDDYGYDHHDDYGYDHHDDYGYEHSNDYGRGHRFARSAYAYYREAATYRKLKQESRYNDYEDSEYYLKKVYGDKDDQSYGEEHNDQTNNYVPQQPQETQQYQQTQPTYARVVVDPAAPVDPAAAAVDGTIVVDPVTVVAPAIPVPVVDVVPVTPALPVVADDNPVGLATEDSKIVVVVQEVADVATPDPVAVVPDVPAVADPPIVVVVVLDGAADIPAIVDNLAQLIQTGDAGAVTAQQLDTPVLDIPAATLAIAVPTVTLPADNIVKDTLVGGALAPEVVDVATPDVVPQTVPTTIAVKANNKDKMKAKHSKAHH